MHKNIIIQLILKYQKINCLQDILYFKCARIKCKICHKLLIFLFTLILLYAE